MEISIMHPLKQIRVAPRVRRLFTLLFACVLGHSSPAADITLTEAMLNDYHLGGGIVDFADSTIGWPPNDVPNTLSPGDTIYIEGHTRKFIRLINITQGTASDPITITNTGGQFILESPSPSDPVARGILLMGAQHVILKGTPDPGNYDYGIKIASTKAGSTGVKVSHNGETGEDFVGSFDVEITGIEIGNTGFAGIQIKSEIAEADLPEEGYIMDNIRIHNNYIHDTHGEGMYLGWTSAGHHDMSNIKVYNNLLVNTGWDGIQFNRCIEGGEIYNNTIYGYAHTSYTANEISQPYYWQNSGIGIGDSEVKVYNNWVQAINKWAGSALSIHTTRPLDIFNNVLVIGDFESDTPEDGIYITQNSTAESGAYLKLYNNTLIEPERCGVYINASVTVPMYFTNNIIANPILNSHILNTSSASLTTTTNLLTTSISAAGFVDASNDDYHLSSGSSAVDTNVTRLRQIWGEIRGI